MIKLVSFSKGNENFSRGVTDPRCYEKKGLEMAKVDEERLVKKFWL